MTKKRVLLAISGSISAYKAADVVSMLKKEGHDVQCLLTQGGSRFVTPLVLETLSGNPVQSELFGPGISGTEHIRLARWADVFVFAPASAHLIARLALGLADDLVTTVALACDRAQVPWLIAPAMNTVMWEQAITQAHVRALREGGARFIDPASGTLACGEEGAGKLASPESIVQAIRETLATGPSGASVPAALQGQDLAGKRVLITAGPTVTHIDAVRYITNPSTGRMGAAMAEVALARGAEVFYVLGTDKGVVRPAAPAGCESRLHLTEVRTAEEMLEAALKSLPLVSGVIATAAVMDYRVAESAAHKLKRAQDPVSLRLVPSADVLQGLRDRARPDQWFFGFAAETDQVEDFGREKLRKKKLDFLFANRVARQGEALATGFGTQTNAGYLIDASDPEKPVEISLDSKVALASRLWDQIAAREKA